MRLALLISLMLLSFISQGQKFIPVGEANSYTLTEADGYPGSNYITGFEYAPTGKVYAKDFFGTMHITGNNFVRYLPKIKNIANNTSVTIMPGNEVWLFDENMNISIIRNDSFWKTFPAPVKNAVGISSMDKRFFTLQIKADSFFIYEFKNYSWSLINKLAIPQEVTKANLRAANSINDFVIVHVIQDNDDRKVYEIYLTQPVIKYLTTIPAIKYTGQFASLYDELWQENTELIKSFADFAISRTGRSLDKGWLKKNFILMENRKTFIYNYGTGLYEYLTVDSNKINPATILFETKERINSTRQNSVYPYITVLTGNKPFRVFPYIKKYPRIYSNNNSQNIFSLGQDAEGRIWAGNYQNQLSIIDDPIKENHVSKIIRLEKQPYPFMNASVGIKDKMFLVGETDYGGVLEYDMNGNMRKLKSQMPTGFFLYFASRGKAIYYPSAAPGYPVYYCSVNELQKPITNWKKIDSSSGILPFGMASITEDTLGRIWMGHPKKGFAVYNPETKKGITYSTTKNETPIGFISSTTDKYGTVWMGSDNQGLWYYNDYTKPANPENIHRVNHPLLNTVKRITSMAIYNDWLVMGCYDRVCFLNIDSFYKKKKIILRYLNPQEANFSSFTEQNTMLVSKADSSLWFSTSDMLYRLDIKRWLQLPTYKVNVAMYLQHDSTILKMDSKTTLSLSPAIHGFDISFEYLSPDCLPRFTRTSLVTKDNSPTFGEPNMVSHFSHKNLRSGHYTFYLEVFEQDGTTSRYEYSFVIKMYLWQHWWFWTIVSIIFLLPFVLWLNTLRKKAIQQKEISQMNLISMSSQFRPHFILNALNAIGAEMKEKPGAESILSRLGESINLIFNYAQQRKISHSLKDEWALIENVIEIHRIIYLPELNYTVSNKELFNRYQEMELPLGILEINVENALLHGLRNKQTPPYNLSIAITEDSNNIYFAITDNGIGRKEAMTISNYKKNGVGTKNLNSIISILNRYNKNKITVSYIDKEGNYDRGTTVNIVIPKEYHYKY